MYASLSLTLSGCASATMATYVVKEETHVRRAFSPPISRSPSGLEGASCDGRADSLSARTILSGKSSRISTYSNACIFFTNLAGIGTKLLANLKGVAFGLGAVLVTRPPAVVAGVTIGVDITEEGRVGAACTAVAGIRGMSESDIGKERAGRLREAMGPGGVHDAVTQKGEG